MARVNNLVSQFVPYNPMWRSWLDIGTAEGIVAQEMRGYNTMPRKIAMDAGGYPDDLDRGGLFKYLDPYTWETIKENYAVGCTHWDEDFDVISMMDSIQYIEKEAAKALLDHIEEKARRLVLIWTPDGLYPHPGHVAGWTGEEFLNRGYCVYKAIRFHEGPPQVGNGLLAWKLK